jgi:tight adherence protein C
LEAGDSPLTPLPALERLLRPLLEEGARRVERWLGGSAAVARRLREAGAAGDVGRFRAEQVLWGLIGFVAAVLLALAMPTLAGRPVSAVALVGGAVLGVGGGVLGRDWWLGRQVVRRQARMLRELPTLADMLCLAVTAGEGPRAALERVVTRSRGELSRELAVVLADLRAGEPFVTAVERLAVRAPMPPVARFVDGLVVAVERGTPLGDVLRAQAADVREQHKRDLIEAGGRREVLMLVPSSIGLVNAADLRFRSSARTVMGEVRRSDPAPWRLRAAYSVDFRRWLVARLAAPGEQLPRGGLATSARISSFSRTAAATRS